MTPILMPGGGHFTFVSRVPTAASTFSTTHREQWLELGEYNNKSPRKTLRKRLQSQASSRYEWHRRDTIVASF